MKTLLMTLAVILVSTACTPHVSAPQSDTNTKAVTGDIAGPNYIALDGTPVPEGASLAVAESISRKAPAPKPITLPLDGPGYEANLLELKRAVESNDPGRLLALPTEFSSGYPVYPATCTFYPDSAECQLESGEVVDEDYLVLHTTVVRNIDVLKLDLTCGKICVDETGRVLGHVSKEMVEWLNQHCTWEEYGTAKCP